MTKEATPTAKEIGTIYTILAIVACAVILAIIIGVSYTNIMDRLNGEEAYRVKAMREQRDGFREVCEENYKNHAILIEWLRQQNLQPAPSLLISKNCIQPTNIEREPGEK